MSVSGSIGAYVGPDRRQRLPRALHEPNRRLLLTIALAVLVYGIAVPTAVAEMLGSGRTIQAATVATIVCAILFAQGGLLLLLRWRLTGDGRSFQLGVAFLVFGFFVAPLAEVFHILASDQPHQVILQSVAQSVVGIIAAVFAVKSVATPPVDSRLRLARSMAFATGALVVLSAVAYLCYRALPDDSPLFSVLVAAVAAAAWLSAGGTVVWRGRGGRLVMSQLLSAPLLVLGLGAIASALSVRAPVPFSLDASALTMSAGVLVAGGAAYALLTTLSNQGASAFRLRALLRNLEHYRAMEEERTHDARSALLAVHTAVTSLTRYREHLDDQSRTNLELAVDSELERLIGLMANPSPGVRTVECRPFDVVEPVVAVSTAAATFGVDVRLDLPEGDCRAIGNRDDTARVLETLLDNARRYAAGSPIRVQVRGDDQAVRVVVADRGPGIAPEERDLVFSRGGRGRASCNVVGSGLGLFAARRLMEDQEGALLLARGSHPGATFVISLRAAPSDGGATACADGRSRARRSPRPAGPAPLCRPLTPSAPAAPAPPTVPTTATGPTSAGSTVPGAGSGPIEAA